MLANGRLVSNKTYSKLMHELDSMDIIDAHEHLIPEEKRISKNVDTIEEISARIAAGNKPRLYQKIFDKCVSQVEKIVGHLQMAKEDFAEVFAEEIHRGRFDFNEAVRVLKQCFYDNPKKLYNLS